MNIYHQITVAEGPDNVCYSVSSGYIFPLGSYYGQSVCATPHPNSYIEALTPNEMVFGGGTSAGDEV